MDKQGRIIVYLSGPITGVPDYMERFANAEKELTERGYSVINPASALANLPELRHWQYVRICLSMLDCADAIYMLNGYQKSKGAMQELRHAEAEKMTIYKER